MNFDSKSARVVEDEIQELKRTLSILHCLLYFLPPPSDENCPKEKEDCSYEAQEEVGGTKEEAFFLVVAK